MINTMQFMQATPEQKEAMIKDGLAFVSRQIDELERNARVLSGWMSSYPDHVKLEFATLDKPIELIRSINELKRKIDDLTEAIVNWSLVQERLLQFTRAHITKKQLHS